MGGKNIISVPNHVWIITTFLCSDGKDIVPPVLLDVGSSRGGGGGGGVGGKNIIRTQLFGENYISME